MDTKKTLILTIMLMCLYVQYGESLKCWDCNSFYDPHCADPFDNHTLAMVDCDMLGKFKPHLESIPPTLCRKLVQKISGSIRYVRSCGWLGEAGADDGRFCFARAGTFEIQVNFCACDSDGCNTSNSIQLSTFALVITLATSLSGFVTVINELRN